MQQFKLQGKDSGRIQLLRPAKESCKDMEIILMMNR